MKPLTKRITKRRRKSLSRITKSNLINMNLII